MKRRQAEAGMLRSGNSVGQLQEICSAALDELAIVIAAQYQWVASTALFLTQSAARSLADGVPSQLQPLLDQCRVSITAQLPHLGGAHAEAQVQTGLEAKRVAIVENVKLDLEAKSAERSRSVLRNLGAGLGKLFGKG
ncbi:MAG: hypothetical protein ABI789_00635 [Usitatibacter sp.]